MAVLLEQLQRTLEQAQVHDWAGARFCYACRLIERSASYPPRVQQSLTQKAYSVLAALLEEYSSNKPCEALPTVKSDQSIVAMRQLTQSLMADVAEEWGESQVLERGIPPETDVASSEANVTSLKAYHVVQKQQSRQYLSEFMGYLDDALPTEPGPLNPEKLLIRLLKEAYTLSPDYMQRLLNVVDTLIWLERLPSMD